MFFAHVSVLIFLHTDFSKVLLENVLRIPFGL